MTLPINHSMMDAKTIRGLDVYHGHARRDLEASQRRRLSALYDQFAIEKAELSDRYHDEANRILFGELGEAA